MVDSFFRHFSGHTQVNAADLRRIRYPDIEVLTALGRRARSCRNDQDAIDQAVVEEAFYAEEFAEPCHKAKAGGIY